VRHYHHDAPAGREAAEHPSRCRPIKRVRCKTVVKSHCFPFGHLRRQCFVLFDGERGLVQRIAVADLIRRQRLLQELLDKLAALARGNGSLEPPDQLFREAHE
jgi:hypothetical protein